MIRALVVAALSLSIAVSATIMAGTRAGNAMARAPDRGCALPWAPWGIPAALDAAISGPADKDHACMRAPFIPEARLMFVSPGADGAPSSPQCRTSCAGSSSS